MRREKEHRNQPAETGKCQTGLRRGFLYTIGIQDHPENHPWLSNKARNPGPASHSMKFAAPWRGRDPRLRDVIRQVGPCTLNYQRDHFQILVRTIISQQISTKAAQSISTRFWNGGCAPTGITAHRILATSDETVRGCGLSGGKLKSLRDLCAKVLDETVKLAQLCDLPDEAVRESLVQIRGIGPWSADMFLIFSLGRLDVLPVGDLGLRAGVKKVYGLRICQPHSGWRKSPNRGNRIAASRPGTFGEAWDRHLNRKSKRRAIGRAPPAIRRGRAAIRPR